MEAEVEVEAAPTHSAELLLQHRLQRLWQPGVLKHALHPLLLRRQRLRRRHDRHARLEARRRLLVLTMERRHAAEDDAAALDGVTRARGERLAVAQALHLATRAGTQW